MIVGIAGGNLQGVEATYLALKAGWRTIVVDRRLRVPASGLCDRFVHLDVAQEDDLLKAFRTVDLIVPALENQEALDRLVEFSHKHDIPLAFDPKAYVVSSSKVTSDALFQKKGIPAPLPWPRCGFPAVGKPDSASGSHGVIIFKNSASHENHLKRFGKGPDVLQEYVTGPSYSMEVMGMPGQYLTLQTTELFMDDIHDCCRVTAPVPLSNDLDFELARISMALARAVNLKGIMDVEVILHRGQLKVLEIDARLPSQTPTAVFCSTGINMVAILGEIFCGNTLGIHKIPENPAWVSYEHISVSPGGMYCRGEHIMSVDEPLHLIKNLFGADEVITNYRDGNQPFVATLINVAASEQILEEKRRAVFINIAGHMDKNFFRQCTGSDSLHHSYLNKGRFHDPIKNR